MDFWSVQKVTDMLNSNDFLSIIPTCHVTKRPGLLKQRVCGKPEHRQQGQTREVTVLVFCLSAKLQSPHLLILSLKMNHFNFTTKIKQISNSGPFMLTSFCSAN